MPLLVLITHERSGVVREAFNRIPGIEAWSCDLEPAEDGSPKHIQGDAVEAIKSRAWGFIGMHPECKYLCVSGLHWNNRGRGWDKTNAALAHALACRDAAGATPFYLENSIGILSTHWRQPDQIIQPHQFGEDASKATCLWLQGLPLLSPTRHVAPRLVTHNGKLVRRWANQTDSGQNRLAPSPTRSRDRARTYPGIAAAMAHQWAPHLFQKQVLSCAS